MRPTLTFTSLVFIFSLAGMLSGQTQRIPMPSPPQAAIEIVEQPGSPLKFSVDEQAAARFGPVAALKVTNVGKQSVRAFIIRIDDGPGHYAIEFLLQPLEPGADRMEIIPTFSNAKREGTRQVSFDAMEFADGTAWGADTVGKAKKITDFYRGRNIAIAKLKELIGDQDPRDFMMTIEAFRSSSFGGQISNPDPREENVDYAVRGYEQIISLLRTSPRRPDEAKEFARKLELMQTTALQ